MPKNDISEDPEDKEMLVFKKNLLKIYTLEIFLKEFSDE